MARPTNFNDGFDTVLGNLRRVAGRAPDAVGRAMFAEAQIEMTEMKRRTPVLTGALRASGKVSSPEYSGRTVRVPMSFGGPAAPYAIHVHEDLEAHHPVGQAKFAESVLLESAPYMAGRIARRILMEALVR
jgi:hypothetical protein